MKEQNFVITILCFVILCFLMNLIFGLNVGFVCKICMREFRRILAVSMLPGSGGYSDWQIKNLLHIKSEVTS